LASPDADPKKDDGDAKSEDAKVPGIYCGVKGDRPNEIFTVFI